MFSRRPEETQQYMCWTLVPSGFLENAEERGMPRGVCMRKVKGLVQQLGSHLNGVNFGSQTLTTAVALHERENGSWLSLRSCLKVWRVLPQQLCL